MEELSKNCKKNLRKAGGAMTILHAFLLGMMVAWTPTVIVLALLLWGAPEAKHENWLTTA